MVRAVGIVILEVDGEIGIAGVDHGIGWYQRGRV